MSTAIADMLIMCTHEIKKASVRRCLFGRTDPETREQMNNQIKINFKLDAELFEKKWGINPITDQIVSDAKFEVVPLTPEEANHIPSFYTKTYSHKAISRKPRQNLAAKRKLSYDSEDINDENLEILNYSQVTCGKVQLVETSPTQAPETSNIDSCLCPSEISIGGLHECSNPELAELAKKDFTTPTNRQTRMTDFLPAKKKRIQSCQKFTQHQT